MLSLIFIVVFTNLFTVSAKRIERGTNTNGQNASHVATLGTAGECNPYDFVQLNLEHSTGMFTGGLREKARQACNVVGPEAMEGLARDTWLSLCHEGVNVGKSICAQMYNGPSIMVPDEIVSLSEKHTTEKWSRFVGRYCSGFKTPETWKHFRHCHHACQFLQLGPHGVARSGTRARLSACLLGCGAYVNRKAQKDGGPSCRLGTPIEVEQVTLREDFRKRCNDHGGVFDSDACVCTDGMECIGNRNQRSRPDFLADGCRVLVGGIAEKGFSGFMDDCEQCRCG